MENRKLTWEQRGALWLRLGIRLVLAALVLCTASLVDASYNPFLYFRF